MSMDEDRRIQGTNRIPFEALVEVGGALGPTFEAQAVDLSEEGMHLRTAYLPEVGQPLTCRFDAGSASVMAAGEVVWREEAGRGGEFGIRFTNLDAESVLALDRIVALARGNASQDPGARVRLHIEGLGAPMRARVKEAKSLELRVGSELGFLQLGKQLDLEDAATGSRRPARIDRVDVETDASSHIPQLVVTLRYEDAESAAATAQAQDEAARAAQGEPGKETTPGPSTIDGDPADDAEEAEGGEDIAIPLVASARAATTSEPMIEPDPFQKESDAMKSAFGRSAAKVGPALASFARRAKTTLTLLASSRARAASTRATQARRTTSPPPGGGLHTSGRRVVRGDSTAEGSELPAGVPQAGSLKRKALAGGVVASLALVAVLATRRQPAVPPQTQTASAAVANAVAEPSIPSPPPPAPLAATVPPPPPSPTTTAAPVLGGSSPLPSPPAAHVEPTDGPEKRHLHVAPFGVGAVAHANVLRLKMDGPIEKLEGASTPTGFSVRVPNRRSLEPAAPLAAKDGRIASMHISNEANGAELGVSFKDGVPGFQVRAKGDVLEILIAPVPGTVDDAAEASGDPPARSEHVHSESTATIGKKKKHRKIVHPSE
jgi:hypothetical protein